MTPEPTPPDDTPVPEPISPEMLAWARQTFDLGEYLAGVREIEGTGGLPLEAFIDEIRAAALGE